MKNLIQKINNLAITHPDIAAQWHPTKNGDLTPEMVTSGSHKKVWWYLPYDDPKTGKHFDFEWQSKIVDIVKGNGCPYLSGKAVWKGFNDLATTNPELASEWHPTLNRDKTTDMYSAGSAQKIWWLVYAKHPVTGESVPLSWQATIANRINGKGCPYISKPAKAILVGFNDLATTHPNLASEWHPTKNGNLTPEMVTAGSNKKIWWNDKYGHEWRAIIYNRVKGSECPICAKELQTSFPEQAIYFYIKKYFPDAVNGDRTILDGKELDVYIPSLKLAIEYDCMPWHKDINKDIKKNQLCKEKRISLIRVRDSNCPIIPNSYSKNYICKYDFENYNEFSEVIQKILYELTEKNVIININKDRLKIQEQYIGQKKNNNLAVKYPNLAAEWHPTKNGNLTPDMFTAGSSKKVWWLLHYDDIKTGKSFDFEWKASIVSRVNGLGCPYLSGYAVWKGFNDLETTNPEIAKEWHPIKNGDLKPDMVICGSHKKVWWNLPYDDPKTGKHFDFEWEATIVNRTRGSNGCPYLSGKAVWKGFNDLETTNPEITKEWHPIKNGNLKPDMVTPCSNKKVWWYLPYSDPNTGMHFEFEWKASIRSRTRGNGCPYLSGQAVWKGFNDLDTLRPNIASEWHPTKNGNLKPDMFTIGSEKKSLVVIAV